MNVSTIERLVRRLRDTGRVADRPRETTPRQDRDIRLAHLRNRHVIATETALSTVGNHNRHIHVYIRRGERFADAFILERDRFAGGSLMVLGGISHGLK